MMQSHVRDRYKDMMMLGLCSDHLYTVPVHELLYMPLLLIGSSYSSLLCSYLVICNKSRGTETSYIYSCTEMCAVSDVVSHCYI